MAERPLTEQCKTCAVWDKCDYFQAWEEIEDALIKTGAIGAVAEIYWLPDCPERDGG